MANEVNKNTGRQSGAKEAAQPAKETANEKRVFIPKEVDPHQIVTVRNGFQGRLVYKSPKTGERFVWEAFGAEQDMEIGELRNAKSRGFPTTLAWASITSLRFPSRTSTSSLRSPPQNWRRLFPSSLMDRSSLWPIGPSS